MERLRAIGLCLLIVALPVVDARAMSVGQRVLDAPEEYMVALFQCLGIFAAFSVNPGAIEISIVGFFGTEGNGLLKIGQRGSGIPRCVMGPAAIVIGCPLGGIQFERVGVRLNGLGALSASVQGNAQIIVYLAGWRNLERLLIKGEGAFVVFQREKCLSTTNIGASLSRNR